MEIDNPVILPCESHYIPCLIIEFNFKFPLITLEEKDYVINYVISALSYVLHFL